MDPAVLVLLYVVFKNNRVPQGIVITLMFALCVTLADRFASGLCKPYFARFRPTQDPELMYLVQTVNDYRGGLYGFISSHAANTFAVAMFASLLVRYLPFTCMMFLWAMIPSYSRIYVFRCPLSRRYFVRGSGRIGCRCACVPAVRASAQEILRLSAVYLHPIHQGRIYQG